MAFPNPQVQPPQVRDPKSYFVPNEICYWVRNNTAPGAPIAVEDAVSTIRNALDGFDERLYSALDNEPKIVALPGVSAVFCRLVPGHILTEIELLELIKKMNERFYNAVYDADRKGNYVPHSDAPFQVLAAAPNWLSGAQQSKPVGTGGPGGVPVLATSSRNLNFDGNIADDIKADLDSQPAMRGTGQSESVVESATAVNIYVLDTAPRSEGINHKCEQYNNPEAPENLVHLLFGDCGDFNDTIANELHWGDRFSIHYNPTLDTSYYLPGHHYDMRDHGLFIASLIAQQYPQFFDSLNTATQQKPRPPLKIHLIQVLSDYGVGTMESFLWGLAKVIELQNAQGNGNPSIVNCSWVLAAPCQMEHMAHLFEDEPHLTDLESYLMSEMTYAKSQHKLPEADYSDLVSFLNGLHVLREYLGELKASKQAWIFACAGNDRKRTQSRPSARYPAAYVEVVGVTALAEPAGTVTASYANIADDPSQAGFAIWGGENEAVGVPAGSETIYFSDVTNSPVGLYFNEAFPDEFGNEDVNPSANGRGGENTTGLAHWSGTSFATPLAVAAFAASLAWRWHNDTADIVIAEDAMRATGAQATGYSEKTIPLQDSP